MKIIVQFSGGKDSHAALIWAVRNFGAKNVTAVFNDTGWEHEMTYQHIMEVAAINNVELVTLKSRHGGFVDLAKKKKRFPSTKARFCTEKLKVEPFIDYLLDEVKDDCIIIQGIRWDESASRSKMPKDCTYFRYWREPYGNDKSGKSKFRTYRKDDVLAYKWVNDILRPVIEWSAIEVINYILDAGQKPNPLYYMGAGRVGCMPCIMTNHSELRKMFNSIPELRNKLEDAERIVKKLFFPPGYIPDRFCSQKDINGNRFPSSEDVYKYVSDPKNQAELFPKYNESRSCMSAFNICE